jgi:uncharacterized protein YecE (DUF72 family)
MSPAMAATGSIHIGTSGWHYPHWKGPFYPEDLRTEEFLQFYLTRFHTVKINNSFYQLPQETIMAKWRDTVPRDFIFALKGSRFITHMKKLKDPESSLAPLLDRVETLAEKLGAILFQLPPRWRFNAPRLEAFLQALPAPHRYALEFRDQSWINPRALEALAGKGVAFCIYDFAGYQSPREVTANFVYIRLHGPGGPYQGQYSVKTLAGWAGAVSTWSSQGKEIFCYFDNDEAGYAAQDALRLQEMLTTG